MKGRIKIHSPTKLFLHTKGSKKSCIYYMYLFVRINSVTIIVQWCMYDILQLRKNYFISTEDTHRPKIERIGPNGFVQLPADISK